MSAAKRIQQLLSDKPGLKAQQIAAELGLEKSDVATPSTRSSTPKSFRTAVTAGGPGSQPTRGSGTLPCRAIQLLCQTLPLLPRLPLARKRRRIQHSGRSGGSGIRQPRATSFRPSRRTVRTAERCQRGACVQKVRREPGQLALYIGYGVRIRTVRSKDHDEIRLEPVLLYPIEESGGPCEFLRPASGIPHVQSGSAENLPSVDSGNIIDEAIQLSEELGLANTDEDCPHGTRSFSAFSTAGRTGIGKKISILTRFPAGAPLADLTAPGIYNRAMLFAGTRSPFTYGLEIELRKLGAARRSTPCAIPRSGSGCAAAIRRHRRPPDDRPILEVLPLNTEQRQAVVQGLAAPLTVVTGPPGTGKSQVVTSLLVNQAWHGRERAVLQQEQPCRGRRGDRASTVWDPTPLLLRLGKEEHHAQLAQHLTATLAESSSADDATAYAWQKEAHEEMRARYASVQRQIAAVVSLRNRVDELERAAEPARALFPARTLHRTPHARHGAIRRRLAALSAALDAAREDGSTCHGPPGLGFDEAPPLGSASRRLPRDSSSDAARLCVSPASRATWDEFRDTLADRLEWAARVQAYLQALDELRAAPPLETLARELTRIADESAHNSVELWQCWLRLRPARWKPGAAQAAERICFAAADDRRRRPLRRRRRPKGISPLLQPVSQSGRRSCPAGR